MSQEREIENEMMARGLWAERFIEFQSDRKNPRRVAFARVGNATRRVIDRLVATLASNEDLDEIGTEIEGIANALERFPMGRTYEGFSEAANAGSPGGFFDHSPISGVANPIAPPLQFEIPDFDASGEQRIIGRVNFGSAYEGPPGCVHGGYLAASFDELLGRAQSLGGNPGMTANLSINYRKPTPLKCDLEFEGILVKVDGRKVYTRGTCKHNGILTAEAEALFVSINFDKLAELARIQRRV
ncbi:MAG: PaaI family thioesterase [Acidimicrobiaceae bacterium]|nr:PaaI family thioesterase [Acidimicrobiaceae bacterium]